MDSIMKETTEHTSTHPHTHKCTQPITPAPAPAPAPAPTRISSFPTPHITDSPSPTRLPTSRCCIVPSEFEFLSMTSLAPLASPVTHMLSADQLFHEGKLLPLYSNSLANPSGRRSSNAEQSIDSCSVVQPEQGQNDHGEGNRTHLPSSSEFSQRIRGQHLDPLSPKAPTCTSRWKGLFGLKKAQEKDGLNCCKTQACASAQQGRQAAALEQLLAARRSVDAGAEFERGRDLVEQECGEERPNEAFWLQPEPAAMDSSMCPTTTLQSWQMDRAMSGSRASRSSGEEGVVVRSDASNGRHNNNSNNKHNPPSSSARSPTEHQVGHPQQQIIKLGTYLAGASMSPRRGSRGVSPARHSVGNRPTESSRNAIASRLVVRGLDRSYSSPKPASLRRRPEGLRSAAARQRGAGERPLERSSSYSAGVRVSPVINVPVYITPALRKGSKAGIFNLGQLFSSSKKEKKEESPKLHHPHHQQIHVEEHPKLHHQLHQHQQTHVAGCG